MSKYYYIVTLIIFSAFMLYYASHAETHEKEKQNEALQVEKGQILTVEHGCVFCHSPKTEQNGDFIPDPDRLFSGHPEGNRLPDIPEEIIGPDKWFGLYTTGFTAWGGPWGISYAANITPDEETGIGKWEEKDFINIIRLGIHSSLQRRLMPPMPWEEMFTISDEDLSAIFKYLNTVKPVKNNVPESVPLKTDEDLATR